MGKLIILAIRGYHYLLSPLLPPGCRFSPSCSEYSIEAVRKHGTVKGLYLSARRVLKCHPFNPGGYDPVR